MHIYVLDNFLYVLLHNRNGVILYPTAESSWLAPTLTTT